MARRLNGTVISLLSLLLMLGLAPAPLQDVGAHMHQPMAPKSTTTTTTTTTTSHTHHRESGVPTGTQVIWCGLWNGSNFNFTDSCSHIGDNQAVHKTQHTTEHQTTMTTTATPAAEPASTTMPTNTADTDNDNDAAASTSQTSTSSASSMSDSSMSQSTTTAPAEMTTTTPATDTTTTTQPAPSNSSGCSSDPTTVTCGNQTVPTGTAVIWCGLWGGSNFDVSGDCANIGENQSTQSTVTQPMGDQGTAQTQSTTTTVPSATTVSASPPSNPQPMGSTYAALGDSVAAGLGLPLPANADSSTTACGRSTQGYPNLVASNIGLPLQNFSCSGTTAGDLLTSETVNGVEQSPQLDQAFTHGTPKFISITAGANDIEWSFFLRQCHVTNCADTTNTLVVNGLLITLQAKLHVIFSSIQHRSNGIPPTTVITGYYQPVSAQCVQQTGGQLTAEEITWIQAATNALNQTIKQTAEQYSFVRFAPVSFAGHDACSSDPWTQGLSSPAPFHPTAQGQQVIAQDVEAAMRR